MYKAWLIYNQRDAERNREFIRWMVAEAAELAIDLNVMYKEKFTIGVKNASLYATYEQVQIDKPDFAIVRNIDELFSSQLQYLGINVYNSAFVSEIANNKAKTHQFLARHGIPMADTVFLNTDDFRKDSFSMAFPCVVKKVRGRGGEQVYKMECLDDISLFCGKEKNENIIVQKMAAPGRDVRVFVVGKQIVAAILRESNTDFRANYSLGGTSSVYQLSAREQRIVRKIMGLFDFGMVGIDFIFDEAGNFLLNEIEDVVGSRTLSKNTDINIVRIYLRHILDNCLHAN
ncbi:ATP-grasp domain-containing protein [Aneurinibacillus sp. Ricciae_BoGa-3]|uniref:ATP-grasp domain-containing protein n=1 Tax=Aneurinibacillus sp. Ricciae_BoGa-3 TaxID=3022697 RepID=UPI002342545B|nr:ATP-grasp domain-containing protein [Aneurinibacillus sp. Ricciae_BoGa-3]WCK54061.1 ATP-grasp domain-containing protein [Aneurinibacillus sp. Ricciae_BoGa-3]